MPHEKSPEQRAAEHKRYFHAMLANNDILPEHALELTKHYIHAEALAEVMMLQGDDPSVIPPGYTGPRREK